MQLKGLPFNQIIRWTRICKECYGINCQCDICHIVPEDLKKICKVKAYVLETYKRFGKPKEDDCIEIKDKILKIKELNNWSLHELALNIGINEITLKNFLKDKCYKTTIEKIKKYMEDNNVEC